jgi:hypothetical protein
MPPEISRRHQVAGAAQAHRIELQQHDVADQVFRQIGVFAQRKGHVVEHAEVGEQGTELKQHPHAPTRKVQVGALAGRPRPARNDRRRPSALAAEPALSVPSTGPR